ncbi:hypothetical protein R8Z57_05925 [Microbacterium sp. M3]|uniref:Uncharacterized protein n=1 Tax=Microbacterium arthrosphaerae TaxID=792652 RepID=A0ABU4GZ09_9MICO|nr:MULTISPECIES: hypothetical protein [Microbacterium]MDW4572316.1 hypothetical protein [Microbacterium arthrosphaerae]MDW7606171.1 hypothetical protein [Microbacterium sp. M3]
MGREDVLAWVESPLQLIGAAEWAAAHGTAVPVAGRLTAQISETADELLARGARFGELEPYLGIPWSLLARHGHWLVGDGFSGQFRLAAAVLRPRRLTFLDDGGLAVAYADTLLGRRPYARPSVQERGLTTAAAPFAAELVHRRAAARRADLFTAFDLGAERQDALSDRGFGIRHHDFSWTRATAPAAPELGRRVVLGSALPVDGRMLLVDYVRWVRDAAADAAVYLPHRRETAEQLDAVATVPGLRVHRTGLPVELVLAGARGPLDVHTLPSSTTTTLPLVLAGTGVTVHTGRARRSMREAAA